jgi:hypothetical protein
MKIKMKIAHEKDDIKQINESQVLGVKYIGKQYCPIDSIYP